MIQVTFFATIKHADEEYTLTAKKLRMLAIEKYGCLLFESTTEGSSEIAVSMWPNEAAVNAWRSDPTHQQAMQQGIERWYSSYRVVVCEVKRDYAG